MKLIFLRSSATFSLIFLFVFLSYSQNDVTVNGKVNNDKGEPLSGVTIQVKNGNTSTTSNADGTFAIKAPSANSTLVLSYVGFYSPGSGFK